MRLLGPALLLFSLAIPASAQVSADVDLRRMIGALTPRVQGKTTCGIETVGYRFVGQPGKRIRYSGETYAIGEWGQLEVIANPRRRTYAVDGRSLPLDVWPKDAFGFRVVPVK